MIFKKILLIIFLELSLFANSVYNSNILDLQAKVFPKIILLDNNFEDKLIKNIAVITILYEEIDYNIAETLKEIKQCGIRAGIVLNPETSAEVLTEEIWKLADVIQVMTVHPGRDGQHFIEDTLDKIKDIRRRSTDTGEWKDIEVDGSINCGNIGKVIKAGANIIVSGKALFNGNLAENIANMKQQAAMEE